MTGGKAMDTQPFNPFEAVNRNKSTDSVTDVVSGYNDEHTEYAYIDLCRKMDTAQTNNDLAAVADGFKKLGNYKDCFLKRKQCLDRLTFSHPDELMFLGKSYQEIPMCVQLGDRCVDAAREWSQYEEDYKKFYTEYDSKPLLLKLWSKYSTLIIIAGIVTLLWGFIIYFGAVLIEFLVRSVVTAIKRGSSQYKEASRALMTRKQAIDGKLADLRNRE